MKKLHSIFTDNMQKCILTDHCDYMGFGSVHRHHVFFGQNGNKKKSEKYGYIAPIFIRLHEQSPIAIHEGKNHELDLILKKACYVDYITNHGTEDDFRREFGKVWCDDIDINLFTGMCIKCGADFGNVVKLMEMAGIKRGIEVLR